MRIRDLNPAEPQLPAALNARRSNRPEHPMTSTGGQLAARLRGRKPRTPGRRTVVLALLGGLIVLLLFGWGSGAVIGSSAQAADLDVVRDLAAHRVPLLTAVAHALSLLGSGFVVFPLAAVCAVALYRRGRVRSAAAVAVSTLGGVLIANVDKLLVSRPRPPVHHLEHVITASFPSGHATQASAFYVVMLIIFLAGRPGRQPAIAAALATVGLVLGIAFSRVYLGVHYPTDTAAGVLLGASWSLLVSTLLLLNRASSAPGSS